MSTQGIPKADDQFEIQQKIYAYSAGIDTKDYELFRSVFTPDVHMDFNYPGMAPFDGIDELATFCDVFHDRFDFTAHTMTNSYFLDFTESSANVRSYCRAVLVKKGHPGGDLWSVYALHNDVFRRGSDGWRIATKVLQWGYDAGNEAILGPELEKAQEAVAALSVA